MSQQEEENDPYDLIDLCIKCSIVTSNESFICDDCIEENN